MNTEQRDFRVAVQAPPPANQERCFWLPAAGAALLATVHASGATLVALDSFTDEDGALIIMDVRTTDPTPFQQQAHTLASLAGGGAPWKVTER